MELQPRLDGPAGGSAPDCDAKVANRDLRGFGWEMAHEAVTRRQPNSLYTIVPRTVSYAYDVGVWDFPIIQGLYSVAPCQTLALRCATFVIAVREGGRRSPHAPPRAG